MKVNRLFVVALCILTTGLFGSSSDDDGLLIDTAATAMGSIERESFEPAELSQPETGSFFSALGVVKSEVIAAALMLGNTFGRMALVGFLGFKGYKSIIKIMQVKNDKRNRHILRAACYYGAAAMLLADGYQWVLRKANAA